MTVSVKVEDGSKLELAQNLASVLGVPLAEAEECHSEYQVVFSTEKTTLRRYAKGKSIESYVDFVSGAKAHRRKFGGGKGQLIAKAVGLNKASRLRILDATAGMGGDAFVLASLGCSVTMAERSPIVYELLRDGLSRAGEYAEHSDPELLTIIKRMHLLASDSLELRSERLCDSPQVVYLDPMFPLRTKSAEVKKEMRFFHDLVGADDDSDSLLEVALNLAENRVVVKRPKTASFLAGKEPDYQLAGKSNRFDIYPIKAFEK
ncbi:16S rRNA (guanine1516-N2)-methyltransferase [Alteromonadaceae bacterium Bs31]|nr:16S rRNA (guanine1516-N2)-methyltransferase [Alteromonadaceae bacterium Bs31]